MTIEQVIQGMEFSRPFVFSGGEIWDAGVCNSEDVVELLATKGITLVLP